ncbi:uncharacterized protein LOC114460545 [Gouania willdenowi]|uniref:uncharacterized protein LOC114460545 n=1 Tax=Gouania willdenowi TaxID=441366 RepID=UPI00105513E6|nr:uncharacterized protein LOC114460545 [Gouania willdenowi]
MEIDSDDYSDQSDVKTLDPPSPPPPVRQTRRRLLGGRSQLRKDNVTAERRRSKRWNDRATAESKGRSQRKWRGVVEEEKKKKVGVTVRRSRNDGKRHWDKKHFCVFCKRPQVKIARHLLRKHGDQQEVHAASILPAGSKRRHLLLERLRCKGNYLHNIEVIRQGSGEIVPSRQPTEEVDPRNYLPCPLCLGFFLRADLWKHQVTCRKKLVLHPSKAPLPDSKDMPTEDTPTEDPVSEPVVECDSSSDRGNKPHRKRRVQAAASRLLPICSSASESCSSILHRMNLDNISYEVKSDWLICKYGNRLMGAEDGVLKTYDYVSQKLRELGRLLLAAKSLDPSVRTLQDLLVPGRLSLALGAARKAAGNRWSRPPLAVKSTLKAVCEVAIAERLQDGDWESAARTTDFYHVLEREWDHLGLHTVDSEQTGSSGRELGTHGPKIIGSLSSEVPPQSKEQLLVVAPLVQQKARRRPWSSEEKEAVWRQLGAHVLFHSVPGKELCQRCLDLEPVLKGRHWKDVKNQVHNQIQTQKKQQFHAQMDQEQNQNHSQKKEASQFQVQMLAQDKEPHQDRSQSQVEHQEPGNSHSPKGLQYQVHMDHQDQDTNQNQKKAHELLPLEQNHLHTHNKPLGHSRLDLQNLQTLSQNISQNQGRVQKKHLYPVEQSLQNLNPSSVPVGPFGSDGSQQTLGPTAYPALHRTSVPSVEQLLSRSPWPGDYPIRAQPGRSMLQDGSAGGQGPNLGHAHF